MQWIKVEKKIIHRVIQYRDGIVIKKWESHIDAARELNIAQPSAIVSFINGKTPRLKSIRGYQWDWWKDEL